MGGPFITQQEIASQQGMRLDGHSMSSRVNSYSANLISYLEEFHLRQAVITCSYDLVGRKLMYDKVSFDSLICPPQAHRAQGYVPLEAALIRNLSQMQDRLADDRTCNVALVGSPGPERSYLYIATRDPNDPSRFHVMAVEFMGSPEGFKKFCALLSEGSMANALDGPAFFSGTSTMNAARILSAARATSQDQQYLERLEAYLKNPEGFNNRHQKMVDELAQKITDYLRTQANPELAFERLIRLSDKFILALSKELGREQSDLLRAIIEAQCLSTVHQMSSLLSAYERAGFHTGKPNSDSHSALFSAFASPVLHSPSSEWRSTWDVQSQNVSTSNATTVTSSGKDWHATPSDSWVQKGGSKPDVPRSERPSRGSRSSGSFVGGESLAPPPSTPSFYAAAPHSEREEERIQRYTSSSESQRLSRERSSYAEVTKLYDFMEELFRIVSQSREKAALLRTALDVLVPPQIFAEEEGIAVPFSEQVKILDRPVYFKEGLNEALLSYHEHGEKSIEGALYHSRVMHQQQKVGEAIAVLETGVKTPEVLENMVMQRHQELGRGYAQASTEKQELRTSERLQASAKVERIVQERLSVREKVSVHESLEPLHYAERSALHVAGARLRRPPQMKRSRHLIAKRRLKIRILNELRREAMLRGIDVDAFMRQKGRARYSHGYLEELIISLFEVLRTPERVRLELLKLIDVDERVLAEITRITERRRVALLAPEGEIYT